MMMAMITMDGDIDNDNNNSDYDDDDDDDINNYDNADFFDLGASRIILLSDYTDWTHKDTNYMYKDKMMTMIIVDWLTLFGLLHVILIVIIILS